VCAIQANVHRIRMLAAKVNRMTAIQIPLLKRRDRDALGFEFFERRSQSSEILVIGKDDNVTVTTKLYRAVKHASLTAHKQVLCLVGGKRRKDFVDRVRDQGSHLRGDRIAITSSTRAIAQAASGDTTPSTNPRHRELLPVG
jgi:hypothetical protein